MSKAAYPVYIYELSEADGGGFAAIATDLHGCIADGDTQQEALANIQDAILEWIDEAKSLGRDIPDPGSRAKAAHEERMALIRFVKENYGKIDELKQKLDDIEEQLLLLENCRDVDQADFGWVLASLDKAKRPADQVH